MSSFCKVCVTDHPLERFGVVSRGMRGTRTADYCLEMAALQPYERTRIRKRNEDPVAFLSDNAKQMKRYRDANPHIDHTYNEKRRKDPSARMRNCVINSARQKGIEVCAEDVPVMTLKLTQPCFYCGHEDFTWALNGLDRIDSKGGYTDRNTVPSCDVCNYMKLDYALDTFLDKVEQIASHHNLIGVPDAKAKITFGQARSREGPKRACADKSMELSFAEQRAILSCPCHYCAIPHNIGMDRVDSELPYSVQNVVACCTMCNYMKKDMKQGDFMNQCLRISVHQKLIV